jgi:ketosteroid isomerase-like protein
MAAAVLALAGCGGTSGPSDQSQIETSLTTYYKAFAQGDTAGACGQLAKDTLAALEKAAHGKGCSAVLGAALKRPDYAAIAPKLARARVTKVTIAGDKATAAVVVPGVHAALPPVPMLKEGGSWKIASAPGSQ